jgi:hypothetical protein
VRVNGDDIKLLVAARGDLPIGNLFKLRWSRLSDQAHGQEEQKYDEDGDLEEGPRLFFELIRGL